MSLGMARRTASSSGTLRNWRSGSMSPARLRRGGWLCGRGCRESNRGRSRVSDVALKAGVPGCGWRRMLVVLGSSQIGGPLAIALGQGKLARCLPRKRGTRKRDVRMLATHQRQELACILTTQAGGQTPRGLPISHSWPNGSTIRPRRQPCSSPTADAWVAPAATACATTCSGSSTTSSVRLVVPSIALGLNRFIDELAAVTQNAASPTHSWATRSSPSPTRCMTLALNAA